MRSRTIATMGLLTAVALILGYVEHMVALSPVPGVKLGIANTVLLYALYLMGPKQAWILMGLKVALSGILFSGPFAMLYSLAGGIISLIAMTLGRRISGIGVVGVSVLGAAGHNLGQLLIACLVAQTGAVVALIPLLLFSAAAAGVVTGLVARVVIHSLGKGPKADAAPEQAPYKTAGEAEQSASQANIEEPKPD